MVPVVVCGLLYGSWDARFPRLGCFCSEAHVAQEHRSVWLSNYLVAHLSLVHAILTSCHKKREVVVMMVVVIEKHNPTKT